MTSKERILTALDGQRPDHIPLTVYEHVIHRGEWEIPLREAGLAYVRVAGCHSTTQPNVRGRSERYSESGYEWTRNTVATPLGELTHLSRTEGGYGSQYVFEHWVKEPRDYAIFTYMVNDTHYAPRYEAVLRVQEELGEAGVVMTSLERSPFQKILIEVAGIERASMDWLDGVPELRELYAALCRKQEELLEIVADSPAELVWVPDNITGEVIGAQRFAELHAERYARFAAVLHPRGKKMVVHMDGKLRCLAEAVGRCPIDVVEALTPPPDGDLSVAEARAAWPGKILWLNFPSSVHIARPEQIAACTRELVAQAADGRGFLIGVTENVPDFAIAQSLATILSVLNA